jgi:molybdopterin-guanine dinucleotide biosynthesis protein A
MQPPPDLLAYSEPLDAIVLAGTDDNPRRMIQGQNKAFLEIGGKALVRRVVEALLAAGSVGRIFIVGPTERLRAALEGLGTELILVPQVGKMVANAWEAIHASEARFREQHGRDEPTRPLFFISCDLPLISAAAVDDFVRRCAEEDLRAPPGYAMLAGVADECSLKSFYPREGEPGVIRPYVHLDGYRVRLANLYVGRPRFMANQAFLQTGFEHRKAEKWKHVIQLTVRFLSQAGGWQAAWASIRLQATLLASKSGGKWYRRLRRGNEREKIEQICSKVLGGPIRMVVTPYGGLSLDADNEEDFRVLDRRFEEWRAVPPVEKPGEVSG